MYGVRDHHVGEGMIDLDKLERLGDGLGGLGA